MVFSNLYSKIESKETRIKKVCFVYRKGEFKMKQHDYWNQAADTKVLRLHFTAMFFPHLLLKMHTFSTWGAVTEEP